MKKIRKKVFETNSSSTHSMTIYKAEEMFAKIPQNEENYDICKVLDVAYNKVVIGEVSKLRYLLALISARVIEDVEDGNLELVEEYYSYWGAKSDEGWLKFKDAIITHCWIEWLCELIKEKCNTTLIFSKTSDRFPYISDIYSFEDYSVSEMLGIHKKDVRNKEVVKKLFEDIVFNPNIIIEDRVDEH